MSRQSHDVGSVHTSDPNFAQITRAKLGSHPGKDQMIQAKLGLRGGKVIMMWAKPTRQMVAKRPRHGGKAAMIEFDKFQRTSFFDAFIGIMRQVRGGFDLFFGEKKSFQAWSEHIIVNFLFSNIIQNQFLNIMNIGVE
jgi:hypothetical protein